MGVKTLSDISNIPDYFVFVSLCSECDTMHNFFRVFLPFFCLFVFLHFFFFFPLPFFPLYLYHRLTVCLLFICVLFVPTHNIQLCTLHGVETLT